MCQDCWEEYSVEPLIWIDDIPIAAELVEMLYEEPNGGAGGPLHVFLDDWNIDGVPVPYQLWDNGPAMRGLTLAIVEVMTPMNVRQRAEVLFRAPNRTYRNPARR